MKTRAIEPPHIHRNRRRPAVGHRALARHHRPRRGRNLEAQMLLVAAERPQISPMAASITTISSSTSKANGLGEQIDVTFFPDNQLGQEIDVINSVKLGVIDMMVSGSSISANLVPLVGTFDLGYLFNSFPQQTKAFDAGAAKPIEEALLKGANIRIIAWAYNFGARSVLCQEAGEDAGRSRRPQDPHAAQSDHHRMPAPDGRRRDAAGLRRDLHRAAGRRARRAGARSADHSRQQVLRDREESMR